MNSQHARLGSRLVLVITLVAAVFVGCGESVGNSQDTEALPIIATTSGFTVTLTAVSVSADETLLTFRIEDEQPGDSPVSARYNGIVPKLDLELIALQFSEGDFVGEMRPIRDESSTLEPKPIVAMEQDVVLGPSEGQTSPVTVVLKQLRFTSAIQGGREQIVEGPWRFTFSLNDVTAVAPTKVDVNQSASSDGVSFVLEQIEFAATESIVTYRVDSVRADRLEQTELVARVPDGGYVTLTRIENEDGRHIAHFAPFPAGAAVEFTVPAMLAEIREKISISIPIVVTDGRADPLGEPTVMVENDALRVTEIAPTPSGGFSIRVENMTPGTAGRILLGMPGASATLVDNLGNVYERGGGSTNLEKSSLLEMWAGGSSFGFPGEIPAEATSLTLTTESYALVLGPWTVTVQLP